MRLLSKIHQEARQVVQPLVDVALSDTGGAEAAAQVLLSCHDGGTYHLCVRDLCVLDDRLYQAAMLIIRLRVEHGIEPHELFVNDNPFPTLAKRWGDHLHIVSRGERYGC
ncbi:hypothetical protein J7438_06980 [Thalassotalea sp. G20_0]|uniref:DUF7673 family protein n=1 Tax=Thalassotalea sp. G20_0 TaxID=2821093 RepID=UPI001ADCB600|nr:hypothetical protein [Thalassotalea sp. G20_0]MBO9493828.1 hypothetical protein [Thalassotalea sp. G20_0]